MRFLLHKNFTLATLSGHSIAFEKNKLTYVPKEAWKEATAIGAVPEDELPEDALPKAPELTAEERQAMLFAAIEQVVTKGDREAFTGNGSPHAKVLSEIVGFTIDAKERDAVWAAFRQAHKAD